MNFSKYEGAGNDFILIDDRTSQFPQDAALIERLCHRRFGIGADGLILLQTHPTSDFRMRIFNSNGCEAEGCGNGLRCLMRFLTDLGLPSQPRTISVGSRQLRASYLDDGIAIDMGAMTNPSRHTIDGFDVHHIDSGVPHAVLFVPDPHSIPLERLGPAIRHHSHFAPKGANVNLAARQPDGTVHVRTYERGVEAETLACGTGATAVAVLGARLFGWPSPVRIRFAGGDLSIHLGEQVTLVGPARKVFEGALTKNLNTHSIDVAV